MGLVRRAAAALALVGAAFYGSGAPAADDEGLSYLEASGRYADLVKAVERRFAAGAAQSATLLGPLCAAYGSLKHYAKLFDCIARLEARIRAGDTRIEGDRMFVGAADARPMPGLLRAQAFLEFGDYEKAIPAALAALREVPPSKHADYSNTPPVKYRMELLAILTISANQAGDREQARKYLKQIEDQPTPIIGWGVVPPLRRNALARAYMALGAYDKALENLDESALWNLLVGIGNVTNDFAYRGDSVGTPTELPRLLMRATCFARTGRQGDAKLAFDGLLALPRLKDNGDLHWLALFERARIAELENDPAAAARYLREAVEVIEQQRSSINSEASKIGFVGDKQAVYAKLISILVDQGRAEEAFDYIERSKSRALVDMLASKRNFAAPPSDRESVGRILAQLDSADLAVRVRDETVKPGEGSGVRNLQIARQQIKDAAPELSTLVTVSSVPLQELRSLLAAEEALVEYYYQGKDLYVFVVGRENLKVARLDASGLDEQVQVFRKAIEEPQRSDWQVPARALHERLWKPVEGLFSARDVIVVAHGALHYLPFAALQGPDGGFLIDRYGLRFLPSASVIKFLRPAGARQGAQLLALGNPDLGDPRLDLKFAEVEARAVAELVPDSKVLTRRDASESNLKKAGSVFSRIHFATHGKFQGASPLESGLYLAKDADNDGVLTVGELYSMNLDADLVTLSACETGLGKIANGDDVVGLTRGFLYAGSRSIVASLWSVDDMATAELMKAFYGNLGKLSKREALRLAQIQARQSFPHPFYWAAFQLTGRGD